MIVQQQSQQEQSIIKQLFQRLQELPNQKNSLQSIYANNQSLNLKRSLSQIQDNLDSSYENEEEEIFLINQKISEYNKQQYEQENYKEQIQQNKLISLKQIKEFVQPLHNNNKKIQCARIIYVPQKYIAEKPIYYLKNAIIVNEETIKELFITNKNQICYNNVDINGHEISYMSEIMHFKFVDQMFHEKKKNNVEFLSGFVKDYQQSYMTPQYLINRFKSFGNVELKNYADYIEKTEILIKQLQKTFELEDQFNKKSSKVIQEDELKDIQYIFNEYKQNPVMVAHYQLGLNNRLIDLKSVSFNEKSVLIQKSPSIDDFIQQLIFKKKFPEFLSFQTKNNLINFQNMFALSIFNGVYPLEYIEPNILLKALDNTKIIGINKIKYIKQGRNIYMVDIIENYDTNLIK